MNRVLTTEQMRQAESASEKLGVSLWRLMLNAGTALAEFVLEKAREIGAESCAVLCGTGNNGGDGLVCADHLASHGFKTEVFFYSGMPKTELAKKAYSKLSGEVKQTVLDENKFDSADITADIIVDCIFGTGFHGEFRGEPCGYPSVLNRSNAYKIACDMPSGIDSESGTAAEGTLQCDATLTFHRAKYGMVISPARKLCGEMTVADIGIPDGWEEYLDDKTTAYEMTSDELSRIMPVRPEYSHKGTFGRLLLICGCESYIGAAAICSRAALHSGCGIVNLAAPKAVISAIAGHTPECVYTPLPADSEGFISANAIPKLTELANSHDAVAVGCGLGQTDGTQKLVEELIKNVKKPLLIDADGINQLAKNIDVLKDKNSEIVLTPHIGELARLSGVNVSEAIGRRYELCRSLTEKYGVILHSKDATSLTFSDKQMKITNFGCSALAKGGSGDMLAGIIGSLLAQGQKPDRACVLADYIMGRTAEILCETYSPAALTAADIISAFKTTLMTL